MDHLPSGPSVGGAPLNVACHLSAFGHAALLVTRIGRDLAGERILGFMAERSLSRRGVQRDESLPTGRVLVEMREGQPAFEILPDVAFDAIEPAAAEAAARSAAPALVYFGTLAQRRELSRKALRRVLGTSGGIRFLDVNLRRPWFDARVLTSSLRGADVLKLNELELETLSAGFGPRRRGNPVAAAEALLSRYEIGVAFVTRGERGAFFARRRESGFEVEEVTGVALGPELVDTVGAGDGFAAVAILGTLRGWQPALTLVRADSFARALCCMPGAVPAAPAFYEGFRNEWGLEAA